MSDWPDWKDLGRQVEIVATSGAVIVGKLTYDDMSPSGPDEFPILLVEDAAGVRHDFASAESWRYI